MHKSTVAFLNCPSCQRTRFRFHRVSVKGSLVRSPLEGRISDAVFECRHCLNLFPVVGGLPLWVPDAKTYLLQRRSELETLISRGQLAVSSGMRQFLNDFAPPTQGTGYVAASWETDAGLEVYKYSQFRPML